MTSECNPILPHKGEVTCIRKGHPTGSGTYAGGEDSDVCHPVEGEGKDPLYASARIGRHRVWWTEGLGDVMEGLGETHRARATGLSGHRHKEHRTEGG